MKLFFAIMGMATLIAVALLAAESYGYRDSGKPLPVCHYLSPPESP